MNKRAFARQALKILEKGRKPLTEASAVAARKAKLLAEKGPHGLPKYMEVPRGAYSAEATGAMGTGVLSGKGGKATAKAMEGVQAKSVEKALEKQKPVAGFGPFLKVSRFEQGFKDELLNIRGYR